MRYGRMSVTVDFSNATVFDVSRIEVNQGERFLLRLNDFPQKVKWFSDNDPVLDIRPSDDTHVGYIKSAEPGKSTIEITSHGRVLKKIHITVRPTQADHLDIAFGEPVKK